MSRFELIFILSVTGLVLLGATSSDAAGTPAKGHEWMTMSVEERADFVKGVHAKKEAGIEEHFSPSKFMRESRKKLHNQFQALPKEHQVAKLQQVDAIRDGLSAKMDAMKPKSAKGQSAHPQPSTNGFKLDSVGGHILADADPSHHARREASLANAKLMHINGTIPPIFDSNWTSAQTFEALASCSSRTNAVDGNTAQQVQNAFMDFTNIFNIIYVILNNQNTVTLEQMTEHIFNQLQTVTSPGVIILGFLSGQQNGVWGLPAIEISIGVLDFIVSAFLVKAYDTGDYANVGPPCMVWTPEGNIAMVEFVNSNGPSGLLPTAWTDIEITAFTLFNVPRNPNQPITVLIVNQFGLIFLDFSSDQPFDAYDVQGTGTSFMGTSFFYQNCPVTVLDPMCTGNITSASLWDLSNRNTCPYILPPVRPAPF